MTGFVYALDLEDGEIAFGFNEAISGEEQERQPTKSYSPDRNVGDLEPGSA